LRAPGILFEAITRNGAEVTLRLPDLQPGESNTVVLGWTTSPSDLATAAVPSGDYTASVEVTLEGDIDTSNNQATATVTRTPATPVVAAVVGAGSGWGLQETTCRTTVDLAGLGEPGSPINVLLDDKPAGNTLI